MNGEARKALAALTVFAAFFFASLLGNAASITESNMTTWLVAVAVPSLAVTALIRSYRWLRVRITGEQLETRFRAVVSASGFGLLFGVMLVASIEWFGLEAQGSYVLTIALFTLSVGGVGVTFTVFENNWIAENERRRVLLDEGISVALARQDMIDINDRLHLALSSDIDETLAPARLRIEERLADEQRSIRTDEWEKVARQLRSAADNTVRPLSHRLWTATAARDSPVRIRWVLRNVLTRQPFQTVSLAFIYVLTSFATTITDFGWLMGLVVLLVGVVTIFVLLGGANRAMRRWPQHHASIFMAGIVVSQSIGLLNFELRASVGARYTWAQFIGGVIIGTLLILLTSSLGSIRTHREDVARTFQSDIDRELVQSIAASRHSAQLARESARILHGSVQTRLIACAVAIEHASEAEDAEAFQAALHEAQQILRSPIRGEDIAGMTVVKEVQRKVGLWEGLCSIDAVISPEVAPMDGRLARDVGRVVEEGLSNAIRHGRAKAITVSVEPSESGVADGVVVVVEDNGIGPGDGERGLGSSMLDSVSNSWELTESQSGSRLVVAVRT